MLDFELADILERALEYYGAPKKYTEVGTSGAFKHIFLCAAVRYNWRSLMISPTTAEEAAKAITTKLHPWTVLHNYIISKDEEYRKLTVDGGRDFMDPKLLDMRVTWIKNWIAELRESQHD